MLPFKEHLSQILINTNLLTQEQLNEALRVQKEKGGRLSDILIDMKFIKEADLISTMSQRLGLPLIDLKRCKIDPEVVKLIPIDLARNYQVMAISRMSDIVTLAMADPLNIFAIDHIETLTGYKINPIISSPQEIAQAIEIAYPDSTKGAIDDLVKEISVSSIEVVKEEKEMFLSGQELSRISSEAPVIKVANMLMEEGVKKKSSDILIEPLDRKLRVRYRIDGILREQSAPPKGMHQSIVSRIKVMSNLDIAEHRLPQDGRFKLRMLGREVDFRVSILPSSFGEKVALRILDKSQATLDIEKLGFSETAIAAIKKLSKLPHGMMLVCGPTGSGKTTTLYSILKFVDSPQRNIVTVEDPVEYQLDGINQVTVNADIGLTFASSLRSILRQDPNIIMIGEIRDFETVDIAIKSALTGHLVLSTLHTTTAPGAVVRLINMGVEPYLINASLICVVAQRLLRKICPYCKTEFPVKPEIMQTLRIKVPAGQKVAFFRGKGCTQCFNLGYAGRLGILEILVLSPTVRELILNRAQEHMIKGQGRKEGMKTLREEGLGLALKGLTTLEEVVRVTAPDE